MTKLSKADGALNSPNGQSITSVNWAERAKKYEKALSDQSLKHLAGTLGLSAEDLKRVSTGWRQRLNEAGLYTFPECDGNGSIIGIATRSLSGEKSTLKGSKRGLTLVKGWKAQLRSASKIFLVEGPSDVAAACAIGIFAIGRPSARGGVESLAQLLKSVRSDQEIVVLGENDPKPDGTWPGRDGAERVATKLSAHLRRKIEWALPPGKAKDLRAWLKRQK